MDARTGSAEVPHAIRIVGHAPARAALRRAASGGTQALLLVGPPASGKRMLARWLAQALCCTEQDAPCGRCRPCRLVAEGHHPDVHLDHERAPLRIEGARALQRELALLPAEAPWRIAVLGEIEAASPGAANSLLKTLEEPPAHAVLVLTAAAEEAVLATIRSRCRRVRLLPTPWTELAEALVEGGADPSDAELAARVSGGRFGRARALLDDPDALAARRAWLDDLERALSGGRAARIDLAAAWARRGDELPPAIAAWCSWWRDVLLLQLDAPDGVTNRDRLPALRRAAQRLSPAACAGAIRACEAALRRLAAHAAAGLVLDVLLLDLPDPEGQPA